MVFRNRLIAEELIPYVFQIRTEMLKVCFENAAKLLRKHLNNEISLNSKDFYSLKIRRILYDR